MNTKTMLLGALFLSGIFPALTLALTTNKDLVADKHAGDSPSVIARDGNSKELSLKKYQSGNAQILNDNSYTDLKVYGNLQNFFRFNLDHVILGNANAGAITISRPQASTVSGRIYVIKKIDSSGNAVIIDPNGTETVDEATTHSITMQYNSVKIINN